MRHDHRERVVDAERRDDHGDGREHQQERSEEAEEAILNLLCLIGGKLIAGHRGRARWQHWSDRRLQLLLRDSRLSLQHDRVGFAFYTEKLLSLAELQTRICRSTKTLGVSKRRDPDDRHRHQFRRSQHRLRSDHEVAFGRGPLVDHHLALARWRRPCNESVWIQCWALDPTAS